MVLEREDSVAGFLGVHLTATKRTTQQGIIKRIFLQLVPMTCQSSTLQPRRRLWLVIDKDGEPAEEIFSYPSLIGMLLYLSRHSRPDITYAVSQCARFIHNTRKGHEAVVQQVEQCLKSTQDEGLILRPSSEFNIESAAASKVQSGQSRQHKTHASHEIWTSKRRMIDDYCPPCLSLKSLGATGPMLEGPRRLGGLESPVSTESAAQNPRLTRDLDFETPVD